MSFPAEHAVRAANLERMATLENEITELVGHLNAATARLLDLVREFDQGEGWGGEGVHSCAHWLNAQRLRGRTSTLRVGRVAARACAGNAACPWAPHGSTCGWRMRWRGYPRSRPSSEQGA